MLGHCRGACQVRKVSALIRTHNVQDYLDRCLRSVAWCDEILVVDDGSTDGTVDIARQMGARVVYHPWEGFAAQVNFGSSIAANDWILVIDADEEATPELERGVREVLSEPAPVEAYRIRRTEMLFGRPLRFGTSGHAHRRLFDRTRASWTGQFVHGPTQPKASFPILRGRLIHWGANDLRARLAKIDLYARMAGEALVQSGARPTPSAAVARAVCHFLRVYLLRLGFLDGIAGFVDAALYSHYVLSKYLHAHERWRHAELTRGQDAS